MDLKKKKIVAHSVQHVQTVLSVENPSVHYRYVYINILYSKQI